MERQKDLPIPVSPKTCVNSFGCSVTVRFDGLFLQEPPKNIFQIGGSGGSTMRESLKNQISGARTLPNSPYRVNHTNCLSKNLLESDLLPQVRNLLEISFTIASALFADHGRRGHIALGNASVR